MILAQLTPMVAPGRRSAGGSGGRMASASHRLLHRRVLLGRCGYASRSLIGSREGTDDGDAMGARNGRASVAKSANLGLAFAVRVCEAEPNRHGLRTGINPSLNRARTQRDVERRERSVGNASLHASSPRPTSWRRAPRCLMRLQPSCSRCMRPCSHAPPPPKCTLRMGKGRSLGYPPVTYVVIRDVLT